MIETVAVTTRSERRHVAAAWRAISYTRRREVVRSAKGGVPHGDAEAVRLAREVARMHVSPWGHRWFQQPRVHQRVPWVLLVLAVALVGESVLFAGLEGAISKIAWFMFALAAAVVLYGAFSLALIRDCRRLLTLETTQPAGG